jgi:hypothetical protein
VPKELSFEINADTEGFRAYEGSLNAIQVAVSGINDVFGTIPAEIKSKIIADIDQGDYSSLLAYVDTLEGVPDETVTELSAAIDEGKVIEIASILGDLTTDRSANIEVIADTKQATETLTIFGEGGKEYSIEVPVATKGVDDAKKKIDEIPSQKELEIILQGNIDKEIAIITTSAETAQKAFEYTAKVDIAEAEANAKILESVYGSIGEALSSSADLMADALSAIGGTGPDVQKEYEAKRILEQEADARKQSLDLQKRLTESQIEYQEAQTERLKSGKALIEIDTTGVEPAIEMVLWNIIDKAQVRVAGEEADFLLGIS